MNMYLYTDIDIFKTRHQLFFLFVFWNEEGMGNLKKIKKRLWENFGELFRRTREAAGTPKLGMGAKVGLKNSFKNHLLIWLLTTLQWEWTLEPMDMCDGEESPQMKKTNLSGSSCLLPPFLSVSFFLQPLPLLLLCDGQFPDFFGRDRQRRSLHFSKFTLLPVSFPRACLGLTSRSSPVEWRLTPLSVDYII